MSSPPSSTPTSLPDSAAPSDAERTLSAELTAHIAADIARNDGRISFARFMQLALYAPGFGYYSAGRRKLGADGDFVTAPELTPMYGQCLARLFPPLRAALGDADVLEVGAGSGRLARDVLHTLQQINCLPRRYFILEVSAELRARQQKTLEAEAPTLHQRVQWLDTLPKNFRGLVLGNEVLDAMPVERFVMRTDGAHTLDVGMNGDGFVWREGARHDVISNRVAPLGLADGYTSEVNFAAEAWTRSMGEAVDAGLIALIDYGFPRAEYYHPDRRDGTLMCHYRHRAHADPLVLVGLQDITAHVDFSAIAAAGIEAGLTLAGYTSQAAFLLGNGLMELAAQSDPTDTRLHLERMQAIKKLTLPHEMGELFKVIGFTKGVELTLPGFALQDRRHRL